MNKTKDPVTIETAVANQNQCNSSKEDKRSRKENQKEIQIIYNFLLDCTQYEADALRVMIQVSRKNEPQPVLSKDDTLAVNRFLNYGLNKNNPTLDEIRKHRHSRADILMNSVGRFLSKEEIMKIMTFLYGFAINAKDVEDVFKHKQTVEPTIIPQSVSSVKPNPEAGKNLG